FADFQQRSKTFEQFAAFDAIEVSLTPDNGDPTRLATMEVSREFLPTVGLDPMLGRNFTADEDRVGGPDAAMIAQDLWAQLYQRDPGVVGHTIRINDVSRTIVGILPRDADFGAVQILRGAAYGRGFAERGGRSRVDVWLPAQI